MHPHVQGVFLVSMPPGFCFAAFLASLQRKGGDSVGRGAVVAGVVYRR